MNLKIAADEVSVYDDGTIENRRGSFTIDDRYAIRKTILIKRAN